MTLSWNFFKKSLQKLHTYFLISYSPSVASLVEFTFNRVTKQLSICRVQCRIASCLRPVSGIIPTTIGDINKHFVPLAPPKPALHLAWLLLLLLDLPLPLPPASAPCLSVVGRWCETTVFVRTSTLWPFFVSQSRLRFDTTKEFHQHSPENEPQMKVKIH